MELIDYKQPDGSSSPFPLLLCRNVYVLPGVPHLLQRKWQVASLLVWLYCLLQRCAGLLLLVPWAMSGGCMASKYAS